MRSLPLMLRIGALVAAATVVATAGPAGAHAELLESEPAAGGTVSEGAEVVRLTLLAFDPDEPVSVEVTDPAGTDVTVGDPEVDARASTVEVEVEPLGVGEHIVHWHAMADDGDGPSEGTFTFRVREAQGGGWGIWLVWLFALGIPAAIFLRPGGRRGSDR
jgi:methionine-rich copper-binding protein CopC